MKDKIIEIIKDHKEVWCRDYEKNRNSSNCSYYMGGADALGELLEKIEILEEDKLIIEKIDLFDYFTGYNWCDKRLAKQLEINFKELNDNLKQIADYINKKEEKINGSIQRNPNKNKGIARSHIDIGSKRAIIRRSI